MNVQKADSGKSRLDLVVPAWLLEVGHVLSHGAIKYAANGWQHVDAERYHAALLRHMLAYMAGEQLDPETGLHHMAHLACSAMFLHWFDCGSAIPSRTCQCPLCHKEG